MQRDHLERSVHVHGTGAAVTDMIRQWNEYGDTRGAFEEFASKYRSGALNPIDEVEKVNIPLLIIHGSVDSRVQPYQAKIYLDELDKHRKTYKFVELDGADHFATTLFYEHQLELYKSIIDFLQSDCGIGTLQTSAVN